MTPPFDRVARYMELEAALQRVRPDPESDEYMSYLDRLEDIWYTMTPQERRRIRDREETR